MRWVTALCVGAIVALASCTSEQPSAVQPDLLAKVVDGEPLQTNNHDDGRLQSALLTLDDGRRLEISAEVANPVADDCGVLRALFPTPLLALDRLTEADHCVLLATTDQDTIEEIAILERGPAQDPITLTGSLVEQDPGNWVVETEADGQLWRLPLASTVTVRCLGPEEVSADEVGDLEADPEQFGVAGEPPTVQQAVCLSADDTSPSATTAWFWIALIATVTLLGVGVRTVAARRNEN